MKSRYYATALLMVAAAALAFFHFLAALPATVPVHWNIEGHADGYGSPWMLFALGPVLMAAMGAIFMVLPWLSPKRFEVSSFERAYLHIMLIVVALPGYFFAVSLWAAAHGAVDVARAVACGLCLMAILLGNLLGKVRRNFYIGFRTPWTLASERVWYATHRFGAKVVVAAGALGLAIAVAGLPPWIAIASIVSAFLAPIAYSLVYYKRLARTGMLEVS